MIKRFLIGMFVALMLLGGYDYFKHKIVINRLQKIPNLYIKNYSFRVNKKGFYLKMKELSYQGVHIRNVRLHVPFFSHRQVYAWGHNVDYENFSSKRMKVIATLTEKVTIDYFYMKDNQVRLFDGMFTNRDIIGNGQFSKEKLDFTVHGTMINEGPHDLFTVTCFGSIDHPESALRKGTVQIKVSHVENLLNMIMRGDNKTLNTWQRDLFLQAFGDNVVIPLDIRSEKVYLGPLKIFDLARDKKSSDLTPSFDQNAVIDQDRVEKTALPSVLGA